MSSDAQCTDEIKRKLRDLKKQEIRIRFINTGKGPDVPPRAKLVWDEMFSLRPEGGAKATYGLNQLAVMDKPEFKQVIGEFFFQVYYQYYRENGMVDIALYDRQLLGHLGLPPDAGYADIKKRFRELAKKYHPDTGGDYHKFIELMEDYRSLLE